MNKIKADSIGSELEKLVLVSVSLDMLKIMLEWGDEGDGGCWHGYTKLAEAVDATEKQVRQAMRELDKAGFVELENLINDEGFMAGRGWFVKYEKRASLQIHFDTLPPEKVFYTWQEFEVDIKELAKQCGSVGFIQQMVAITRGGLVVAGTLSHLLPKMPLKSVTVSSYNDKMEKGLLKVEDIEGSPLFTLIVDDILDSGDTLRAVQHKFPNNRTAVLHYKNKKSPYFKPNYYVHKTDKWIVYPWELEDRK